MKTIDLLIIGAGPAGLAAGIQAAHLGLSHVVLDREEPQSRVKLARRVENFPRLEKSGLPGKELHRALWAQALNKGVLFQNGSAGAVTREKEMFSVGTERGSLEARAVIIATGLRPRKLGKRIASPDMENKRLFYRWPEIPFSKNNNSVLVIGGGEVAFDQACSLAENGFEVTIAIRGKKDRVFDQLRREAGKLGIRLRYETEILKMTEIRGGIEAALSVSGRAGHEIFDHCLAAIGSIRNVPDLTPSARQCLNAGLYLAGDAAHPKIKQAVIAFGDGIRRSIQAYEYIRKVK